MDNFAWKEVLAAGWPVLSVLLAASIYSMAVAWERWKAFSQIKTESGPFLDSLRSANDAKKIIAWCEKSDQPLAFIAKSILTTAPSRDDLERALQRSIQALVQRLEANISVLGTVASVAPFIGLLGTVIGIIRAFRAVSVASTGGASSVMVGISEALIGTAAGLFVAIPALLAYNFFVNRLRRLTQDWELSGAEIIEFALRQGGRA